MRYYTSNALYDYFLKNKLINFEFTSGKLWLLVYGDSDCNPKLLAVVSGVLYDKLAMPFTSEEEKACKRVVELGKLAGVPQIFVRFCIDDDMTSVHLYNNYKFKKYSLDDLTKLFKKFGLPTSDSTTLKYLNDRESSAYHHWQRDSIGSSLKVSDIDLMRIDITTNKIETIYELKRSFIELDIWKPYPDDYNNFRLLGNLLKDTNIPLKILYNVRKKNPYSENIDILKIFDVSVKNSKFISFEKIISLDNFIK